MPTKNSSGATLSVIIPTGLGFFLILFFCFVSRNTIKKDFIQPIKNTVIISKQIPENYGLPVRLKIPSINVDVAIESVGLTSGGAMGVPKGRDNVAWYSPGARPGEIGSAVIDGHYGVLKNGNESVFDNLYKLHQGDQLYVEDDKGTIISFVVREIQSYDPKANASDVFGSSDGKSHLNLITCEGIWDKASKSYPKRLVVFTDRE